MPARRNGRKTSRYCIDSAIDPSGLGTRRPATSSRSRPADASRKEKRTSSAETARRAETATRSSWLEARAASRTTSPTPRRTIIDLDAVPTREVLSSPTATSRKAAALRGALGGTTASTERTTQRKSPPADAQAAAALPESRRTDTTSAAVAQSDAPRRPTCAIKAATGAKPCARKTAATLSGGANDVGCRPAPQTRQTARAAAAAFAYSVARPVRVPPQARRSDPWRSSAPGEAVRVARSADSTSHSGTTTKPR
ncbi:hypothetical protein [Rathayibacter sp. VKM Ac-2928]|uniref:hypothetical protein n=1 Tax=Rathayibacter sp. VKM Ac-2928 TaxID=2929479 RepID=UPI001FB4074E|nr:hypothetical protein [Rathayibacter sp. VKM Ac-2928]MCJ1682083.1 hypothetical protein [Rathayibacter sp. VKM Ac-2928]